MDRLFQKAYLRPSFREGTFHCWEQLRRFLSTSSLPGSFLP